MYLIIEKTAAFGAIIMSIVIPIALLFFVPL